MDEIVSEGMDRKSFAFYRDACWYDLRKGKRDENRKPSRKCHNGENRVWNKSFGKADRGKAAE